MAIEPNDIRASAPILTYPEVSALVRMPETTVRHWGTGRGRVGDIVHTIKPKKRGWPSIPLVGLAEVSSLRALRMGGMDMTEIARAAAFIRNEFNDPYALSNPRLMTDGATAFIEHDAGVTRLRDGQEAFEQVIQEHLKPLNIGLDGYVESFEVDRDLGISIDPRYNSGRPAFVDSRIPVFAVLGALRAGESEGAVADDFGITIREVAAISNQRDYFALVA